jgi:hypothetical protein
LWYSKPASKKQFLRKLLHCVYFQKPERTERTVDKMASAEVDWAGAADAQVWIMLDSTIFIRKKFSCTLPQNSS